MIDIIRPGDTLILQTPLRLIGKQTVEEFCALMAEAMPGVTVRHFKTEAKEFRVFAHYRPDPCTCPDAGGNTPVTWVDVNCQRHRRTT